MRAANCKIHGRRSCSGVMDVYVAGSQCQSLIFAWFDNQVEAFKAMQIPMNTAPGPVMTLCLPDPVVDVSCT